MNQFEKFLLMMEEQNPHRLKADIDLQILEACILSMNIKEVQESYMKSTFAEIFSATIIEQFMGDVKLKQIDPKLIENELPSEFIII